MADVVTLVRVEVDEEGFPVLPAWRPSVSG